MAQTQIKAVLFDLGDTLLNYGRLEIGKLFIQAGRLTYTYLKHLDQPVGGFKQYFWRNMLGLRLRAVISAITGNDFDSLGALKKYGTKKGIRLSDSQWEQLNWLWYEPVYKKASAEPDLADTLGKLQQAGLKLGIVSNTFVNGDTLDRHLQTAGLLDFFPVRIYSYQLTHRKPNKRIFLEAAGRIGIDPANIIYVGDRISKDVKGALKAGMVPILKTAHTNAGKQTPRGVTRIDNISELPPLIEKFNEQALQTV